MVGRRIGALGVHENAGREGLALRDEVEGAKMRMKKKTAIVLVCGAVCAMMALAACAPQQAAVNTQDSQQGAATPIAVSWSPESDCAVCHDTQGSSMESIPCAAAQNSEVTCSSCHTDEAALGKVHDGVTSEDKMPKRLKQTAVSAEACEACHGGVDALAPKTAESTVLTDSKGTVVNPHDLPDNERHQTIVCGDCHAMHESGNVQETAPKACTSCHHAGVYECGTCHEQR